MTRERTLLAIIDNDDSVRESLPDLLGELGYDVRAFESAEDFLGSDALHQTQCLILDVALPGMSGPDLHSELARRRQNLPIIYITAQQDEQFRSRLLRDGAVAVLFKPFGERALVEALDAALR